MICFTLKLLPVIILTSHKNLQTDLVLMRYNGQADLMTNKLVTCQIIFYPNITYIYELQLQKLQRIPKLRGRVSLGRVSLAAFFSY